MKAVCIKTQPESNCSLGIKKGKHVTVISEEEKDGELWYQLQEYSNCKCGLFAMLYHSSAFVPLSDMTIGDLLKETELATA